MHSTSITGSSTAAYHDSGDLVGFYEKQSLPLRRIRASMLNECWLILPRLPRLITCESWRLYRLADVQRTTGRFDGALHNYALALELSRRSGDATTIPDLLHMMGVVYRAQGLPSDAITYYELSLQDYRDLLLTWMPDQTTPGNIVLSREDVQRHIANVLRDLGDALRK